MTKRRADAFTILGTPMFFLERARLAELAARARLPAIYSTRQFVDKGGLMAYGASLDDLLRRSAGYVDRILKGGNPADLPVEQPSKFELVINAKTARALGISIATPVLNRADQVID
jgi:putative ABC transport system substrate-binding protein